MPLAALHETREMSHAHEEASPELVATQRAVFPSTGVLVALLQGYLPFPT